MPAAPLPPDEGARVDSLLRYKILDTAPEESFDQLTQIAAHVCNIPVSLISLVDAHRQWFKSKVGLDACETSRESAFCGYTILGNEPLIVRDARLDERFKDNVLVQEDPKIRFYAGCPLISSQGFKLGSLCVIDFMPRDLSESQVACLQALAAQTMRLLEHRLDQQKIMAYAQSLEKTKYAAEQANQAKSLFLATISHEIRTPLNGVVGMLELLSETTLDSKQVEFVDTAQASASTLLSIINDVLDLSKIESGKLELTLQPTNLRKILAEVQSILNYRAAAKGLFFQVVTAPDIPELLELDADRIRQILLNLCSNGIKFTPAGGRVTVESHLIALEGKTATLDIKVTDTGIGIPSDRQQAVLEPFVQGSPQITAQYGGSGLGLTITKRLLDLMGSRLSIQSSPHQGSCFSFSLKSQLSTPQTPPLVSPAVSHRALQILVAEDHPINQKVICEILRRKGHHVEVVGDGQAAIEAFYKQAFDLVLLDLQMPIMDGIEAAQKIRRLTIHGEKSPQIVALTAHALQTFQEKFSDHFDYYLCKPVSIKQLDVVLAESAQVTKD